MEEKVIDVNKGFISKEIEYKKIIIIILWEKIKMCVIDLMFYIWSV
jgi:hypothetical protein